MRYLLFIFLSITCSLIKGQVIDYGIDNGFNTGDFYNRGGVHALLLNSDNSVLVTGYFTHAATTANGISIVDEEGNVLFNTPNNDMGPVNTFHYLSKYLGCGNNIYLFNPSGGGDYSFQFEFQRPSYNGFLSNLAREAFVLENNLLVAGRFFTDSLNTDDVATLRQLCRVDSTGKPDQEFPMLHCAEPFTAEIYGIDTLSTGAYILAGRFEQCNGHTYHNVIKLNPDFSVDTTFVNSLVYRSQAQILHVDSLDRIWVNTGFGGLLSNPTDTVTIVRLLPNGEIDSTFDIPELLREFPDTDPPAVMHGFISRVVEDMDGTFIVTGPFTQYNGISRKKLAKIYDDGTLVEEVFDNWGVDEAVWGTWSSEYGGGIGAIQKLPDGKWLLGGTFSSFGGEPYNCMVRLMPTGYVGVDETIVNDDLQVFPNPTTGWLRLSGAVVPHVESVELYNLSGQVIPLSNGNLSDSTIDLSDVPAGIYVLAVYTSSQKLTRKVVKY